MQRSTPRRRFAAAWPTRLLTLAVLALAPLAAITGCTTNPATGERQLNMLSRDQEIAIGEDAAPEFLEQGGGEIPDRDIQRYVSDLGARLAAISERPDLPWAFYTLDTEIINAFALPGGKVFISRGLMAKMDNEAQLAGVLGHEIGHVTAQHIGQRMTRQMLIQGVAVGAGVAAQASEEDWVKVLGAGVAVGGQLYALSFSRDQELQADTLGVRYMHRADYNPVGQLQVMQILKDASGGGGLEMLQTHPLPSTRIDQLESLIARKYPRARETGAYVFGHDRFKNAVLDRLDDLPPPAQSERQALLTPELIERHGVLVCDTGCGDEHHEHGAPHPGPPSLAAGEPLAH